MFKLYNKLTGAQIVKNKLQQHGVKDIFMYSGGAVMNIIDQFYKNKEFKCYVPTNEQSMSYMLTGYSKSSSKIGVGIVTSGPGLTNLITGMLDANNDSTSQIIISGQVSTKVVGTQAFQECPATEITKNITKWSIRVDDVNLLPSIMDKAFKLAQDKKPGVVHIDIPRDIQSQELTSEITILNKQNEQQKQNKQNIEYIADLINKSQRPIIHIGKGVNNCSGLLRHLISKTCIPVTSTIHGLGIIQSDHYLSLGFIGMHGFPAANYATQEADLIVCIGARLDDRSVGNPDMYGFKARNGLGIVHCNIELTDFNKTVKSTTNIESSSDNFILSLLKYTKLIKRDDWLKRISILKSRQQFGYYINKELRTQEVLVEMQKQISEKKLDPIITTGVGNHQMYACQFLKYNNPKHILTSGSLGVMGVGLPYAIGAQIANPNKMVIVIDGDGSFNQTYTEQMTLARYNLPIKIAIMNDNSLSMVKTLEELYYNKRYTASYCPNNPDYKMMAEAHGITGLKCDKREDLSYVVNKFLTYRGPIICDFRTMSDRCLPLVSTGNSLDKMILHGDLPNDRN